MRHHDRLPDLPYLTGLPRPDRAAVDAVLNRDGNTYLHELCRRDAPLALIDDAVRRLGADIDRVNAQGWTPLGVAILQGSPVLVQRLLQLGASTAVGDFNALVLAVDANKPDMLFVLLRQRGDGRAINQGGRLSTGRITPNAPLLLAAENHRTELYTALIKAGALVNAGRPEDQQTALHITAAGSDARAVPLLLARGADADARAAEGWTALMIAAARNRAENIVELVGAGADIDAVNRLGQSALMIAAEYGHIDCVRALVAAGAKVDLRAPGLEMRTALMLAARKAHPEIVEILLAGGASPLLQDRFNETAAAQVTRTIHTALYARLKSEEDAQLHNRFEEAHRRLTKPASPHPGPTGPR